MLYAVVGHRPMWKTPTLNRTLYGFVSLYTVFTVKDSLGVRNTKWLPILVSMRSKSVFWQGEEEFGTMNWLHTSKAS